MVFSKEDNIKLTYSDVCAKRNSKCVVSGDILFGSDFQTSLIYGNITYPTFGQMSIKELFGNVFVANGTLISSAFIKLRFYLRTNTWSKDKVNLWMKEFLNTMNNLKTNETTVAFVHSDSLGPEISSNLDHDIVIFISTLVSIIRYSSSATANCKCASDKRNLGKAGVFGTLLSVVAAIGFTSSCHVKIVPTLGVMPFLILGIGMDDMFVLLSGLAETYDENPEMEPKERIKAVMKSSGVSITITTATDLVAFYVGTSSSFLSIKNFCTYTGVAVFLCLTYLNYVTFFMACMTIHEHREAHNVHCCTWRKIKYKESTDDAEKDCKSFICSSSKPTNREDIAGPLEKYPQRIISKRVLIRTAKVVIICLFVNYIGISTWGALHFKQGLDLNALVPEKSYLFSYNDIEDK